MEIDYKKKKYLVIDDFPGFRRTVQQMLNAIGAEHVDTAESAEKALELARRGRYDVVVCDYNLGDAKDGQDLHEEMVAEGLADQRTAFLMATAEDTRAMVLASLECEPDAYLTKPFNKQVLLSRLEKVLRKKIILRDIYQALADKDPRRAVEQCDALMAKDPRLASLCLKIKAECLMDLKQLAAASEVYAQVLEKQDLPWAMIGMGRVLFLRGDYDSSATFFQDLLAQNNRYMVAYEWLARCHERMQDKNAAKRDLARAQEISPKSVSRNIHLAELAEDVADQETAVKAWRHAVRFGKHSRHKRPDTYVKLARSLHTMMSDDSSIANARYAAEANQVLDTVCHDYPRDQEVKMRAGLTIACIQDKQGRSKEAEAQRSKALKIAEHLDDVSSASTLLELAEGYDITEQPEKAQQALEKLVDLFPDDERSIARTEVLIQDKTLLLAQQAAAAENRRGMEHYDRGDYATALVAFRKAVTQSPGNISFSLNAAQVLTEEIENHTQPKARVDEVLNYLKPGRGLSREDHRWPRYTELRRRAANIKAGV